MYVQGHLFFLDLHFLQAMLPDGGEGGDTVFTVVDQDVPIGVRLEIS